MHSIEKLSQAKRMLVEASTLEDLQHIRGIAQMASEYARAAKLGLEAQNTAAEIKLRAERKAGELLSQLKRETPQTARIASMNGHDSEYKQTLATSETSRQDANRWQKIATIPPDDFEEFIEETKASRQELTTSKAVTFATHTDHDSDEYYTPEYVIEAARAVMGTINLDPASCPRAQEIVRADYYYTKEFDGLIREWPGKVWLNPPFSDPKPFIVKVNEEYMAGNTTEAIVLVNNSTDTSWGQLLLSQFSVCFIGSRISFWKESPDTPEKGNRYAQMIFYLGTDPKKFYKEFSQFGVIMEPR